MPKVIQHRLSEVDINRPLTVLCHPTDIEIVNDREDVFEITPEKTVRHARNMPDGWWELWVQDDFFMAAWEALWGDRETPDDIRTAPAAFQHVAGMILLILNCFVCKRPRIPMVVLPETYLHPKQQASLMDMINTIRNRLEAMRHDAAQKKANGGEDTT